MIFRIRMHGYLRQARAVAMQVAEVTVRCLRDLDAIDAAIQAEGLCEVQSSLLTTMTYIQFKRLCRDALAGQPAVRTSYHLSAAVAVVVDFPHCMLLRKGPITSGPPTSKRKCARMRAAPAAAPCSFARHSKVLKIAEPRAHATTVDS